MEIYNEIQTFTCDKEMKEFFKQLRKNKVNVSKFIRVAITEKIERDNIKIKNDKRKKTTINDLKESLNYIF
jgi:post-segregation antitoxin (ccd killing protein)